MRRLIIYLFGAVLLTVVLLFLISCEEKCTCSTPVEHFPDYHLQYGPVTDPSNPGNMISWIATFSTRTGEVVDSIDYNLYMRFPYKDFCYSHDGTKTAYLYWGGGTPYGSELWITNYLTEDTLFSSNLYNGRNICIDSEDKYILLYGGAYLNILEFPNLNPIFVDTIDNEMGGFCPGKQRIFYYANDSILFIDFKNRDSIYAFGKAVQMSGSAGVTYIAANEISNQLILMGGWGTGPTQSWIQVWNLSDLSVEQELVTQKFYSGFEPIPHNKQKIVLYGEDIDVYDLGLSVIQAYMGANEIDGFFIFSPWQIEFTPDGYMMYILLNDGGLNPGPVLGVNYADKAITQLLIFKQPNVRVFHINPIDFNSEE